MNKFTITILFIFFYISTSFAQTVLSDMGKEDLIIEIAKKNKHHKTILCDFKQIKHIYVLDHDIISYGKYYYQKDDKMCMVFSQPKGNLMLMNPDVLLIIENGKRSLLHKESSPFAKQMRKMLTACMSGDIAHLGLSAKSKITATKYKTYYQIEVTSNKSNYILQFNHNDLTLKKLIFTTENGDFTEYSFTNVLIDTEIDQVIFDHTKY